MGKPDPNLRELSAEQRRALLGSLLRDQSAKTRVCPASFAQQRMWFLDRMDVGSAYNLPNAFRLRGALDAEVLERSLNAIVERHEILRTTFAAEGGVPRQVIAPELRIPLVVRDLTDMVEAEREAAARTIVTEAGQHPFDLAEGPLVRALLVRLHDDEHVLQITTHHIVSDAWSQGILRREVAEHYRAFRAGETVDVAALPIQYADVATEQRAWLAGDAFERQLDYWKGKLGDGVPVLELPTDRPRPAVQTFAGAAVGFSLPVEETAPLEALASRHQVTLAMLLLAAFQVLLSRYTGQADIAVGSPIANRNRREVEDLIGFFVNTLVMRTDLSGDPTFVELLDRVKDVALAAYEHQDLPFEHLVEELAPERDLSRSPLVQVIFAVQNVGVEGLRLADLETEPYGQDAQTTRFDLEVYLSNTPNGLSGRLCYNSDLFDRGTMTRLVGHYETLLRAIIAEPQLRASELPLLADAERRRIVVDWNETTTAYARDACVHQVFEAQVEQTPDAVAVVFDGRSLTYDALNRRANQVAHRLIELGVGPEVRVGIALDRSDEMVVGILGVLKAGGAYVPLDPEYPAARMSFMMQDAKVPVVLTQSHLDDGLPEHDATVLRLDADASLLAAQPETNPEVSAGATSLAYVMYTSGSTGRPKGVCVSHRSVVRLVRNTNYLTVDASDVFLQFAPISFDASTLELWGSLLNGAKLVVSPRRAPSLEELGRAIETNGVTTLWLTGALFQQMVNEQPEALAGVRQLLAGGDALSVPHVRQMISRLAGEHRLINGYGPTENTTFTCCHVMGPDSVFERSVPIGRPISNTTAYVLGPNLEPVPVGASGELYTGGDGLARGYLNDPALTAARFVPNPFGDPGSRLYRTGDRARYDADGTIEFLGRADFQVKLRGFRIELGEIETALLRQSGVRDAVVLCREDTPGDKRLVAYVTAKDDATPSADALRTGLGADLPGYMIPSAFVPMDTLPLTVNGKTDRAALPAPSAQRHARADYVAPRNPEEEAIAEIWARLLGIEQVGVHDGFFELGGHSLLATQVVSRIRDVLGVEIPLREFFDHGTIADLAAFARGRDPNAAAPIAIVPRDTELPLSFAQRRLWFLDQMGAGAAYNMPWAFHLVGKLDGDALERALEGLVERHETLRTCFPAQDGNPVQAIHASLPAPLPRVDLGAMDEDARWDDVRRRHDEEAGRPFDLTRGPLFRWSLLRLGEEEHVLLLSLHHIISDGWSMGVLTRDLGTLYDAFAHGSSAPLAELPIQYADFSVWQHAWLDGAVRQRQLDFWRERLTGAEELQLPTDYRRGTGQTFRGSREQIELPPEFCEELDKLCRREGVTLFMPLMAAFAATLQRTSGQDDIVVGTPIANRTRSELEDLIGFFVNNLVMRADLSGNPTLGELLARVKETTLAAYEHQDLPFEWLVHELQRDRDPNRNPIFQVMFALQNAPLRPLELGDLTIKVLAPSRNTRFDIEGHAYRSDHGLTTIFIYDRDLFTPATIRRMLDHFRTMLETLVRDGGQRVGTVPLLTDAQRQTIVSAWNRTTTAYPKDQSVPALFARQCQRTPEAPALKFDDATLTYAELNARANQIAHALRRRGVKTGVMVGIFAERGADMVVGLVGILKAGGVYVPLDPEYPPGRLAFMLEETRASVLLTHASVGDAVPGYAGSTLCFDRDHAEIAAEPAHDLPSPDGGPRATDLAYVIYTSGSTGGPKGVCVEHRSIARLVCDTDYVELGPADRVAQGSNASFDAATFEIWGALLNGATLVGLTRDEMLAPQVLARRLREEGITTLFLTTALFNQTVRMAPEAFASLRTLLFGGELVDPAQVRTVLRDGPPERLLHVYGPTETTTFATWHDVREVADDAVTVPIGRPLANTTTYVLDAHGQPVPVGLPGELCIGGDGVARGYLDHTHATADCFVPDPFSGDPGARLYRTGDWVRYDADGAIAFIGRHDGQVKLRGFRIEVGEIESAIVRQPLVRSAVVMVREDEPGDKRLVAYVVPERDDALSVDELRRGLRSELPRYMVPMAFVVMDDFPLTPNGKVDRGALPVPDPARAESEGEYVAPRSDVERSLAEIWASVLRLDRVGVHDDFFGLGGHSLMATQVVSRLRTELGVDLPLQTLFEHPTVAALAEEIETVGWLAGDDSTGAFTGDVEEGTL